jgi:Tol biopolymer transport system component
MRITIHFTSFTTRLLLVFALLLPLGVAASQADDQVVAKDKDINTLFELAAPIIGTIERVSISSAGEWGNNWSGLPDISADGRYVAFEALASNLVSGDTNGKVDVFVRDRLSRQTSRVSISTTNQQGNNDSMVASISTDGRYVAFESVASNLVSGDTNGVRDIFLRDRQTGQTSLVSVDSGGVQGNGTSVDPAISTDGRYVAFASDATNLVSGDTNGVRDIFVRDMQTGQTKRPSVDSIGTQGSGTSEDPSISSDGHLVAFSSASNNLVTGDTNSKWDIFVHNSVTGQTSRVSISSGNLQANDSSDEPFITPDGSLVVFSSLATNLVNGDTNGKKDIFVRNLQSGQTSRVSISSNSVQANDGSELAVISADGRFVTFTSYASNLVGGDANGKADVFIRDRQSGRTSLASVSSLGVYGNNYSGSTAISGDGRFVVFASNATNLVSGDTNGFTDVFLVHLLHWSLYLPMVRK